MKADHLLRVYKQEKEKLSKYLSDLSCLFTLTIDRVQKHSHVYFCLTVHFIDDDWELKNKILNFTCPNRPSLDTFKSLLLDWNIDKNLNPHFKSINLTREEWGEATAIYEFLISLDNVVCYFSLTQYPTTNLYFPKVCNIYKKLHSWEKSDYWDLRKVALYMRWEYFDEYWRNSSLILAITAVLDPRFKMDIVENWYKEIYGIDAHEEHLKMITEDITHVYNKYASSSADANSSTSYNKMLDHLRRSSFTSNSQNIVGELDRYLKEPKFPSIEEFDILTWWRVNTPNFPILTRMARDFLAIPALTPVFDSSFKSQIDHRGYCMYKKLVGKLACLQINMFLL
ncbi:hypothetical protein QYF36_003503 [Acer negundo]|nr:hypothetical protein QYF36_003503 [Acer negundo]